jgi:hypothetical protein
MGGFGPVVTQVGFLLLGVLLSTCWDRWRRYRIRGRYWAGFLRRPVRVAFDSDFSREAAIPRRTVYILQLLENQISRLGGRLADPGIGEIGSASTSLIVLGRSQHRNALIDTIFERFRVAQEVDLHLMGGSLVTGSEDRAAVMLVPGKRKSGSMLVIVGRGDAGQELAARWLRDESLIRERHNPILHFLSRPIGSAGPVQVRQRPLLAAGGVD